MASAQFPSNKRNGIQDNMVFTFPKTEWMNFCIIEKGIELDGSKYKV
jgi:hypothetical protein